MLRVTFDSNVLIRLDPIDLPSGFFMSAVVIQELTAGASDGKAVQNLAGSMRDFEARGKLLVPNGEDWWHAGKILNALYRGLRSRGKGHTPATPGRSSSASSATC